MKNICTILVLFCSILLVGCSHTTIPSEENEVKEEVVEIVEVEEEEEGVNLATASFFGNGTEPFRNFVASGNNLTWTEPSMAGPVTTTSYTVAMSQSGTTITMVGSGVTAVLTLQPCSDGMSGLLYTYAAIVTKPSQTFNGCANVTP